MEYRTIRDILTNAEKCFGKRLLSLIYSGKEKKRSKRKSHGDSGDR